MKLNKTHKEALCAAIQCRMDDLECWIQDYEDGNESGFPDEEIAEYREELDTLNEAYAAFLGKK